MGKKSVRSVVSEISEAIVQALLQGCMSPPEIEKQWKNIVQEFGYLWQFSYVIGAIDGTHAVIKAPAKSVCIIILKEHLVLFF